MRVVPCRCLYRDARLTVLDLDAIARVNLTYIGRTFEPCYLYRAALRLRCDVGAAGPFTPGGVIPHPIPDRYPVDVAVV